MALNEYLGGIEGLDPSHRQRLLDMATPPQPVTENYGAPTPEEMASAGVSPAEQAAAQRFNTPGPMPPQSATNPTKADPNWTPEAEQARTAALHAGPVDTPQDMGDSGESGGRQTPPSPGRYVPAHWQPGSRSETIQHGIDETKLLPGQASREASIGYGQWAADDTMKAATKEAAADAAYQVAHQRALEEHAVQQKRIDDARQAYVTREHEKLESLSVAAQQQVDPEAAKGSAGAQLFAALGVALGEFGASLRGGTNTALQIVNANIDRRIKAQEANIANAHKSLGNEQSLYRENLEAFGDRDRAALATKMQYLDQAKAILDQQYAGAKSNRNDAQYHAMSEALTNKKAEYQDQFGIRTADQSATTGNEHFVPGQMIGGGGGPKKEIPNLVTLSDGTSVQMPNEKQQDKAIEKIQVISKLQRMNNEALSTRTKIAKLDPILDRTAYNTAHKTLEDLEETKAALLSTEAGQGVLRDSEYARTVGKQSFYTAGVGTFKGNPFAKGEREVADANIRRQIQRGDEDQRAFVKAAGGHIVKRGYATDATGQKVPVGQYTGQDVAPTEQLAPKGFKPLKTSASVPTADEPLSATTPQAQDFGASGAGSSAGAGKGGGPKVHRRK